MPLFSLPLGEATIQTIGEKEEREKAEGGGERDMEGGGGEWEVGGRQPFCFEVVLTQNQTFLLQVFFFFKI